MEKDMESEGQTAKQIGDLFEHRPDDELITLSQQQSGSSTLKKTAFVNPDDKTYDTIRDHLKSKLDHSVGEFIFQIGVDGK